MLSRLKLAIRIIRGQIEFNSNGLYHNTNIVEDIDEPSLEDKIILLMERDPAGWRFEQFSEEDEKHIHAYHDATSLAVCSLYGQFSVDGGKTWSQKNHKIEDAYHSLYKRVAAYKVSEHLQCRGSTVDHTNSR